MANPIDVLKNTVNTLITENEKQRTEISKKQEENGKAAEANAAEKRQLHENNLFLSGAITGWQLLLTEYDKNLAAATAAEEAAALAASTPAVSNAPAEVAKPTLAVVPDQTASN